jgi:hypothetical protein
MVATVRCYWSAVAVGVALGLVAMKVVAVVEPVG